MARPKKDINRIEFEKLCGLQCTKDEICAWFDVTDKTIDRWCSDEYGCGFSVVYAEKRGLGKISLRRAQFELAKKNASMAIWLGKNWLDQKDSPVTVAGDSDLLQSLMELERRD